MKGSYSKQLIPQRAPEVVPDKRTMHEERMGEIAQGPTR